MTVVFITHDLEEALYLGDSVIVLASNPGRIVRQIDVDLPRPRRQPRDAREPDLPAPAPRTARPDRGALSDAGLVARHRPFPLPLLLFWELAAVPA